MPQIIPIVAAALPIVGGLVGKAVNKPAKATATVPGDLQGLRGQDISFLSSIMNAPDAASRQKALENFFGPLVSGQQTEASGILSNIGADNGQNVINALAPQYQKNLAYANQSGGRFGSANALMRAGAANDFNVLSAGIANQAQDRRMNAAQLLGGLGQQLLQNRVGLLNQIMSTSLQAGLGQPTTVSPSSAQQGASFGQGLGGILSQIAPMFMKQNAGGGNGIVGQGIEGNNPINNYGFGSLAPYRNPAELGAQG